VKFDITLRQYELVYKILASIGKELAHGEGRSCQFYNVNGAIILEKLFKVKAKPVMGAAFIRLTNTGETLSFAAEENDSFYSSPDAFHCWVETENNIIDFTAPEYKETLDMAGVDGNIKRNMFQKDKKSMSNDPYTMINPGDFFFESNLALTNHLLTNMYEQPSTNDLSEICLKWCKESKKELKGLTIMNDLGEIISIQPIKRKVTGSW
jgi:hypothetical protein